MCHIDDPRPRGQTKASPEPRCPLILTGFRRLPFPSYHPSMSVQEALEVRHSQRELIAASMGQVASVLWYAARTRQTAVNQFGRRWESRPASSAGGLHPIHLLVCSQRTERVDVYDPIRHGLGRVALANPASVSRYTKEIEEMLPHARGTILTLGVDPLATATFYENHETLVWRDAGCLLGMVELVCAALGLGCCVLGILGTPLLTSVKSRRVLIPAGACVIGRVWHRNQGCPGSGG